MDEIAYESCGVETLSESTEAFSEPEELTADEFDSQALSHGDALLRAAWRLTRDRLAAEDLVQETYLRALCARRGFRLRAFGMRPWLLRILRNLHLSRRALETRRPLAMTGEQLDCLPAKLLPAAGHSTVDPDGRPSFRGLEEMDQELSRAILELPPAHQAVLMLWAVEELTYVEVAAAVKSPAGTVMSRLHRARGRLSRQLAGFAAGQGITGGRLTRRERKRTGILTVAAS